MGFIIIKFIIIKAIIAFLLTSQFNHIVIIKINLMVKNCYQISYWINSLIIINSLINFTLDNYIIKIIVNFAPNHYQKILKYFQFNSLKNFTCIQFIMNFLV